MVFQQKKGGVKGKQQQMGKSKNKSSFEEDDAIDLFNMDSDDDDDDDTDSDEQQPKQKTPSNKTPKGNQQVQSDKKVSFQIPGKMTPGKKTPKNETSLIGKKQLTPGKMGLKEFKGMSAKNTPTNNGKPKMQVDEDDDDDDDDDDEDDDADLDMMLGGDDDDDDDDEDEDEEEEDDNDSDEADEEDQPKNKQTSKLNQSKNTEKSKTPAKGIEKTPLKNAEKKAAVAAKTPVKTPVKDTSPQKTPKKPEVSTPGVQKALQADAESRRDRDLRTLFVGNLPNDITTAELKALSNDILAVNLPVVKSKKKFLFAFLLFANEAKAEENYKILQKKKLRNEPLTIDFSGVKSKKRQNAAGTPLGGGGETMNLKRLYVTSIPTFATIADVAKFFPKAFQIAFNTGSEYRTAMINYMDEKDCAQELEAAKGAEIAGKVLTVLYSISKDRKKKRKNKNKAPAHQNPPKKRKMEMKQQSSDDDDDDDDEDE